MSDDFAAIARAMKDLGLNRDTPFAEKPAPDFHAELNAKIQPKPAPEQGDEVEWGGGW